MGWQYIIGVQEYFPHLGEAQKNNAILFYDYFSALGATLEAVCGMLGNITRESSLNPGMMQTVSPTSGWGLIQWTPSTVLTRWCNQRLYNWYDGAAQCYRIQCEGLGTEDAGGTWLPTSDYPYSWSEFLALTDVEEAVKAYLFERERAGVSALAERIQYANEWYEYLSGQPTPPTPPTPVPPTPYQGVKKMPVYMMLRNRHNRL